MNPELAIKLAIASAAVGGAARIRVRPGGRLITSNCSVVLGLRDLSTGINIIHELLAPLEDIQRQHIEHRRIVGADVHDRILQVQDQLAALRNTPFPDPGHVTDLETKLRSLRQQLHVQLIAHDVQPGTLAGLVGQTFDESILHVITSQTHLNQLLNLSAKALMDLNLLGAAWAIKAFFAAKDRCAETAMPIACPTISSIIMTDRQQLESLLRRSCSSRGADLNLLWALTGDAIETVNASLHEPAAPSCSWATLVRRLVDMRSSSAPVVYTLTPDARNAVTEAMDADAALTRRYWDAANSELRIVRLALALHLLNAPSHIEVDKSTAARAVDLYHDLFTEHQRLLHAAHTRGVAVTSENLKRMFLKIGAHQPIPAHEVKRLYDSKLRRWLGPLINALLEDGRVSRDQRGRLVVTASPPPGSVIQVRRVIDGKVLYEQPAL